MLTDHCGSRALPVGEDAQRQDATLILTLTFTESFFDIAVSEKARGHER